MGKRRLLIAAALLLIAAACSNAPDESATTAPPATDTGTTEPEAPYEFLARAEAGEFEGTTVEVITQFIDPQDQLFEGALAPFVERTGIEVTHEGIADYTTVLTARVEGGNAPDLAQIAQPGLMRSFAESGDLVNLSSSNGDLYGIFYQANLKSIVWYPVQAFEDAGYEVPETWDQLIALSDQIMADGNGNPWCLSTEQDAFTGWVITDWIEDILLRTAPVEVYDQWVAHQIPFNHPEVIEAAEYASQIMFTEGYVYGGTTGINTIWVGDTQTPMFANGGSGRPPRKQA